MNVVLCLKRLYLSPFAIFFLNLYSTFGLFFFMKNKLYIILRQDICHYCLLRRSYVSCVPGLRVPRIRTLIICPDRKYLKYHLSLLEYRTRQWQLPLHKTGPHVCQFAGTTPLLAARPESLGQSDRRSNGIARSLDVISCRLDQERQSRQTHLM